MAVHILSFLTPAAEGLEGCPTFERFLLSSISSQVPDPVVQVIALDLLAAGNPKSAHGFGIGAHWLLCRPAVLRASFLFLKPPPTLKTNSWLTARRNVCGEQALEELGYQASWFWSRLLVLIPDFRVTGPQDDLH